jgi:hypothetical protein
VTAESRAMEFILQRVTEVIKHWNVTCVMCIRDCSDLLRQEPGRRLLLVVDYFTLFESFERCFTGSIEIIEDKSMKLSDSNFHFLFFPYTYSDKITILCIHYLV